MSFVWEWPTPQCEAECMARGVREGDAQRKQHRAPGDRFQRANGGHDVLGPVLEGIDSRIRLFPSRTVRGVVVAVDSLDHANESVGVRGTGHDSHPAGARQADGGAAVAELVASEELGGAEEDEAVCAVSPAACDRVSARRSKRRAWTCLAVTWVGEGAPGASRVSRSARRTSSSVPRSAKSLARICCASRRHGSNGGVLPRRIVDMVPPEGKVGRK